MIIIILAINKIPGYIWTDYFKAVNLHPHHWLIFMGWINKISPAAKTGEATYLCTHEGYYYDAITAVWKMIYDETRREVMSIIGSVFSAPK